MKYLDEKFTTNWGAELDDDAKISHLYALKVKMDGFDSRLGSWRTEVSKYVKKTNDDAARAAIAERWT